MKVARKYVDKAMECLARVMDGEVVEVAGVNLGAVQIQAAATVLNYALNYGVEEDPGK